MKVDEVEVGGGNVFADLGLPNPDERLAKARIAMVIGRLIDDQKLTQAQAAEKMRMAQPDVSNIIRGRLKAFTIDRLLNALTDLGQDVRIVILPKGSGTAKIDVESEHLLAA